jgi:hypothetical protein
MESWWTSETSKSLHDPHKVTHKYFITFSKFDEFMHCFCHGHDVSKAHDNKTSRLVLATSARFANSFENFFLHSKKLFFGIHFVQLPCKNNYEITTKDLFHKDLLQKKQHKDPHPP